MVRRGAAYRPDFQTGWGRVGCQRDPLEPQRFGPAPENVRTNTEPAMGIVSHTWGMKKKMKKEFDWEKYEPSLAIRTA